jgi:hypothetical protein
MRSVFPAAVPQLVNVKTLSLARGYAGRVAWAALHGPVAVVPGAQLFAPRYVHTFAVIRSQVCTYVRSYSRALVPGPWSPAGDLVAAPDRAAPWWPVTWWPWSPLPGLSLHARAWWPVFVIR